MQQSAIRIAAGPFLLPSAAHCPRYCDMVCKIGPEHPSYSGVSHSMLLGYPKGPRTQIIGF